MKKIGFILLGFVVTSFIGADPVWMNRITDLISTGKMAEAKSLVTQELQRHPKDSDALLMMGTLSYYEALRTIPDESIYSPAIDPKLPGSDKLTSEGAAQVALWWSQIPEVSPERSFLWNDLATLAFEAGNSTQARRYSDLALKTAPDETALRYSAFLAGLSRNWPVAIQQLEKIPSDQTHLLYQALNAWKNRQTNWKSLLMSFLATKPDAGAKVATYLLSPQFKETEEGFQELLKTESGFHNLLIREKRAEVFRNQFLSQFDLARAINQLGDFETATKLFQELEKKTILLTPEEKQTLQFHSAWALQASGKLTEANLLWKPLASSKDFYLKSAACWFLGKNMATPLEAKPWWEQVAEEPARSKYAYWSWQALHRL